jgi:hypothetical protein
MRNAWSALSPLALAALVIGGTVALSKLNHQEDVWPPIDPTIRYSYCQLEDQDYLRVADRNAYVILETGGPYLTSQFEVERVKKVLEWPKLREQFPDQEAFAEEIKKPEYNYNLSKPDIEIPIPFKENPYRWRPVGRESMHDCYSRMKRDGSYVADTVVIRLK